MKALHQLPLTATFPSRWLMVKWSRTEKIKRKTPKVQKKISKNKQNITKLVKKLIKAFVTFFIILSTIKSL
jgi:hypothetical protein